MAGGEVVTVLVDPRDILTGVDRYDLIPNPCQARGLAHLRGTSSVVPINTVGCAGPFLWEVDPHDL